MVALGVACLVLVVDFLADPTHLDRYGPRQARRRGSDRI
jgi:hypothetical protein